MADDACLVEGRGLAKRFLEGGWLGPSRHQVSAVRGVDLTINQGETVALVGESGCGKTTLARLVLRLLLPTSGEIYFAGRNLAELSRRRLQWLRQKMQIIFQDPAGSLNPRMTAGQIIAEPLVIHKLGSRKQRRQQVEALLARVGLGDGHADRYPTQLSGGQQQRVAIARALASSPWFIVADEPLSALDSSTQLRILDLLAQLQRQEGLSYLFITHDISTVRQISQRVAVMLDGLIVEQGPTEAVFNGPLHPYTELLLSCVLPRATVEQEQRLPSPRQGRAVEAETERCPFSRRCPEHTPACSEAVPDLREVSWGRYVRCIRR